MSTLFGRLGGKDAVNAAVGEFYDRLINDENTAFFFEGLDMAKMKAHQLRFFSMVFSGIPEDLDVVGVLLSKHERLFREKGLNATHFDLVAGHFVGALESLKVPAELIKEATEILVPLRPVFDQGAEKFGPK